MACTASSLMTNAAASGYYGLEDRSLKMAILYMLCSGGASQNYSGTGSPEGVVTGATGAIYADTAAHTLWIKESGTGNTGWVEYT